MSDDKKCLCNVHYCDYSAQPSIRIFCTQTYGTPAWDVEETSISCVYMLGNKEYYTFDENKATCKKCLDKLKEG